ncbi:MAG: transcription elongation factor GreB, partial [Edaphobacter sp.]
PMQPDLSSPSWPGRSQQHCSFDGYFPQLGQTVWISNEKRGSRNLCHLTHAAMKPPHEWGSYLGCLTVAVICSPWGGRCILRWENNEMRKGFTRRPQDDGPTVHVKNYITPGGLERLKEEHRFLLTKDRPAVAEVAAWAASNGDRSENADYQYAKRRLRQIDGRIRFLSKRIEAAEVVDPEAPRSGLRATKAFFGATVLYANAAGVEREVSIVGADEVDLDRNHISWVSPLGRALLSSAEGDSVVLEAPGGKERLTVLEIRYERIAIEPFREPPGSYAAAKQS